MYSIRIFEPLFIYLYFDRILWPKSATSRFQPKIVSSISPVTFNNLLGWNWYLLQGKYVFATLYIVPVDFEHPSPEWVCKIIWQHHCFWTILDFHILFIYFIIDKKQIFICLEFLVQAFLPFFSIPIILWLSWYTILFIISYPCPRKNSLAINCRLDICARQLDNLPWSFFYLTFAPELFRETIHVLWIWNLHIDFSCQNGLLKMRQYTCTHMQGYLIQWFFCN